MKRNHLDFALLLLTIFILLIITTTQSTTLCNQSCPGSSHSQIPFPFGFSDDCNIRLNCSTDGDILIGEFQVQNITPNSLLLNMQPSCNRFIETLIPLFSQNYALTWENGLILQGCLSRPEGCIIPKALLEPMFNKSGNCSREPYCFSAKEVQERERFMAYANVSQSRCKYLYSSVKVDSTTDLNSSSLLSLDFQTLHLGWWLEGSCNCSSNATCTKIVSPANQRRGYRCSCLDGYEGDGYHAGRGCWKVINEKTNTKMTIVLSIIIPIFALSMIIGIFYIVKTRKFAELVENWELIYGTHRFAYKDLYKATKGFGERKVIGRGAFGKVYRGVLPTSKIEVAIKKVSHDSTQGIQQFIAEIVSIGKLRHRNLVQLLGYCRRKGELLLVYDYMPNGSLDKFLFGRLNSSSAVLVWSQRFHIIKGVAGGLFYLHEGWGQVVIHRDIKAANVLLDDEMNARLGDFGLAMLFDHGTIDAPTSRVVGTPGYLAPEMTRIGMASVSTDVYAFGVFLLEVACGRRPFELKAPELGESGQGLSFLVDWVLSCWRKDAILQTSDPNLVSEYVVEEMELVLKLGLLCTHTDPEFRPTMRQVMQYLNGDAALLQSDLWALETSNTILQAFTRGERLGDLYSYCASSTFAGSSSAPNGSVPSGPR